MFRSDRSFSKALLLVSAFALAACGGGSGGGSSSNNDDDGNTETTDSGGTTTFSGSVEVIDGTTTTDTRNWAQRLLAFVMLDTHAAIGGLQAAPDGTPVRLIRIDADGNEVDQLASGTVTDGRFEFEAEIDGDVRGDLIVEAGNASDPVRAPAGGSDITVSPVSLGIVNKILARIAADDSLSLDSYRAADLANLIAILIEELEAQNFVFTGTSNRQAADDSDAAVGETGDELVASVEDNATLLDAFAGAKNLIIQDIAIEASTSEQFGDTTRFASIREFLTPTITGDSQFDLGGTTVREAEVSRGWLIERDDETDTVSLSSSTGGMMSESFTEADDSVIDLTVTSDGRLLTKLASNVRGATSADGQLLALSEVGRDGLEGEREELFAGIMAGAAQWDPGSSVDADFNYVLFDGYAAQNGAHAGFATTLRGHANLNCAVDQDCSLTLTRSFGADTRKFYAEAGPQGAVDAGGSSNTGTLAYEGLALSNTGRFSGTPSIAGFETLEVQGLLAPDARMLVAHVHARDGRDRFQDFLVGLPTGPNCGAGTLSGSYNVVGLLGQLEANARVDAEFGNTIRVERETSRFEADGQGSLTIADARFQTGELRFNDENSSVALESVADTDDTMGYTVSSDCRVEIVDDAANSEYVLGAVSPDGEAFVIATHETAEADQSILIGLRRPQ